MESTTQLGSLLRGRREELKISLKEAENATSIRMSYLQSIEEGKPEKLISAVYAEGFIRQYSNYLGLDGERIIKDYPQIFKKIGNPEFDYGIGTLEVRGNPGSSVKWLPNSMWIVSSAVGLLVLWYLAYLFGLI